jgi:hypothetical protein
MMSEMPGTWGSGQVSGPQIEWRTTMPARLAEVPDRCPACGAETKEPEPAIDLVEGEDGVWEVPQT